MQMPMPLHQHAHLPSCSSAMAAFTCIYSAIQAHSTGTYYLFHSPYSQSLCSPREALTLWSCVAGSSSHSGMKRSQGAGSSSSMWRGTSYWMGRSSGSRLMVQGRIDQRGREERSVRGRSEQQLDDKKPPVFSPVAAEQNCSSCWRWAAAFAMQPG